MVTIRISISNEDLIAASKDMDKAKATETLDTEVDRIAETLGQCVEIDDGDCADEPQNSSAD